MPRITPTAPHCCRGSGDRDLRVGCKPLTLIKSKSVQGKKDLKEIHHLYVNILLPWDIPFSASVKAQLLQTLTSASELFPFCCWNKKWFLREWQQLFHSCFPCQGCFAKYQLCVATAVTALSFCSLVLFFSSHAHHIQAVLEIHYTYHFLSKSTDGFAS